jgi:hypothetical protein
MHYSIQWPGDTIARSILDAVLTSLKNDKGIHLPYRIRRDEAMNTQSAVREKYGSIAKGVTEVGSAACCDPGLRCRESRGIQAT